MSEQQKPLTYESILKMFRKASRRLKATERMVRETTQQMKENAQQIKETDRQMKETDRQMKETDLQMKETDRKIKETNKQIGFLGSRIGEIIENMVKGNIVEKFQDLGYHDIDDYCENKKFGNKELGIRGEIDLFLENGDIAILIEVKTTLETADVRDHIERLEKFRRCVDAKGIDKRRFIGAVAGAVVGGDAAKIAHENGMYVIEQSGEAIKIAVPPEEFKAKKW